MIFSVVNDLTQKLGVFLVFVARDICSIGCRPGNGYNHSSALKMNIFLKAQPICYKWFCSFYLFWPFVIFRRPEPYNGALDIGVLVVLAGTLSWSRRVTWHHTWNPQIFCTCAASPGQCSCRDLGWWDHIDIIWYVLHVNCSICYGEGSSSYHKVGTSTMGTSLFGPLSTAPKLAAF